MAFAGGADGPMSEEVRVRVIRPHDPEMHCRTGRLHPLDTGSESEKVLVLLDAYPELGYVEFSPDEVITVSEAGREKTF